MIIQSFQELMIFVRINTDSLYIMSLLKKQD